MNGQKRVLLRHRVLLSPVKKGSQGGMSELQKMMSELIPFGNISDGLLEVSLLLGID